MATVPETSEFTAGIYQIETTDPVEGGPGGISNKQAEELANRTLWLKNQFFPRELKWIAGVDAAFITANFPAGVGTGNYLGWFVANGANETDDMRDRVALGQGGSYPVGSTGGESTHTLVESEIPALPAFPKAVADNDRGTLSSNFSLDINTNFGGGQPHNNMQPYRSVLCIQKI